MLRVLDVVMRLYQSRTRGGMVTVAMLNFYEKYRRCGIIILCGLAVGVLVGNVCLKNIIRARVLLA